MRRRSLRNRSTMNTSRKATLARRDRTQTNSNAKRAARIRAMRRRALSELPEDGGDHPAAQGQPAFNKYEKGDPSAWGEDVHKGPYSQGSRPATPTEEGAHPAAKSARDMARLERKASKCVRIAELTLGKTASDKQIEKKALSLMDTPISILNRRLKRMASWEAQSVEMMEHKEEMEHMDHAEMMVEKMLEEMEGEEAMEEMEQMKFAKQTTLLKRLARLEAQLVKLAEEEEKEEEKAEEKVEEKSEEKSEEKAEESDEKENAKKAFAELSPAMKRAMFEMMMENMGVEHMVEKMEEEAMAPEMAEIVEEPVVEMMSDLDDPMGVMEESMSDQEMMILSRLFGKNAEEEEKEEEKAEEKVEEKVEEKEESAKKANLKPQPKKASTGATRLGGVSKEASSDISELSKLWASAPDVRKFF